MSNEITVRDSFDTALHDLEKTRRLCFELMKLPHYAKMGEVGIFAITEKAKQIGMHPLEALNGALYFVNGKVEMQGQAMLSMIRKHGHSVTLDPKSTNTHVTMHGKRSDNGDMWTVSFSVEDAKKAGLYKNVWEKYPHTMCVWRCVSMLSRFLFSDILKGCYVVGEISDAPPIDAPVPCEVEVVENSKITREDGDELYNLLDQCDPEFMNKVLDFYKSSKGWTLYDLPNNQVDMLRNRILQNKEFYQESLKAENAISEGDE